MFRLDAAERAAVLRFHLLHPIEGYRHLGYIMLNINAVAVSPTAVYRISNQAELMDQANVSQSLKETNFVQPTRLHIHWHIDIRYIDVYGMFYTLCAVLDGFSGTISSWRRARNNDYDGRRNLGRTLTLQIPQLKDTCNAE